MLKVDLVKKFAYNEVSAAMAFDAQEDNYETYKRYSSCTALMTQNIFLDTQEGIKISATTIEFIYLSLKCLERLKMLAQDILKQCDSVELMPNSANRIYDDCFKGVQNNNLLRNISDDKYIPKIISVKPPMEIAQERNKVILQNLESRLLNKKLSHHEITTLRLAMERKMAENLALAEKQENIIFKKKLETLSNLNLDVEEKQFFTDILNFESNNKWLQNLRLTQEIEFSNAFFVENCIRLILGTPCHPISTYLTFEKEKIYRDAKIFLEENNLANFTGNLSEHCGKFINSLKILRMNVECRFNIAYKHFKPKTAQFLLHTYLEQYIFDNQIWALVIHFYRLDVQKCELRLTQIFKSYKDVKPEDCGVSGSYTLSKITQPYQSIIDNLSNILQLSTPTKKITLIVESMQRICNCYKEYCSSYNIEYMGLGADELVPILVYILMKSQIPELMSHFYALMDFLDEKSSIGEEGYCLTSFLTAIDNILNSLQCNVAL